MRFGNFGMEHLVAPMAVMAVGNLVIWWIYREEFGGVGGKVIVGSVLLQVAACAALDYAGWFIAPRLCVASLILQVVVLTLVLYSKGIGDPQRRFRSRI